MIHMHKHRVNNKQVEKQTTRRGLFWLCCLVVTIMATIGCWPKLAPIGATPATAVRQVNVPYQQGSSQPYPTQPAVFWFGQVNNTSNYADIRTIYDENNLRVILHIMDRRLWYDTAPSAATLTDWDAVTLYLNLDGATGQTPGTNAFQFVTQLSHWQTRTTDNYQATYQGNGVEWMPATIPFTTTTGWRGVAPNNNEDDRGWSARFVIPFTSLGLSAAPPQGTVWGVALAVHDRDDAAGSPIPDTVWPEAMTGAAPASWGRFHFGFPVTGGSVGTPTSSVTVRHGLNGATVTDGHVGGHTVCGDNYAPTYFPGWGSANYAGYEQINIQNQWDIADWPCFSKYFVMFPLPTTPPAGTLLNATLIMHQFGSASGNGVEPSYIQALTVYEDWQEATLTWNNAPLAGENLSGRWVDPTGFPGWPGVRHTWDVTKAVADAYAAGTPVRLALYSADSAYHSGRYFSSSDVDDWNAVARPTLQITWGERCGADGVRCVYLPVVRQ